MKKGLLTVCAILIALMLSFKPIVGQDRSDNFALRQSMTSSESKIELDLCDTGSIDNYGSQEGCVMDID